MFEQMGTFYGVNPKFEHHACVVDLLARVGMLKEAEKFIEKEMSGVERADANVWGALLGASRVYENVEIGNRVWKKLASMGLSDCRTHVLSYNIYREAGWEMEARRVRGFIAETRMKKKPGCSVIEVNGVVEEFLAAVQVKCFLQDSSVDGLSGSKSFLIMPYVCMFVICKAKGLRCNERDSICVTKQ
ncbi:unnamed protein product [Camellia sinensis]